MRKTNFLIAVIDFKSHWVSLNPYETAGLEPKTFTMRDVFKNEVLELSDGTFIKIIDTGSGCFFGADNPSSCINIEFKKLKNKEDNPNRFYIAIDTHNPECVERRTAENPEGSKYGGVAFGGWFNTVEECIKSFPAEHRRKSTGSMYWSKTLKITRIKRTDLETGDIELIEPTEKDNQQLNMLHPQARVIGNI